MRVLKLREGKLGLDLHCTSSWKLQKPYFLLLFRIVFYSSHMRDQALMAVSMAAAIRSNAQITGETTCKSI